MSEGVGVSANFRNCYKCGRKLKLLEMNCPACGTDNSKLKIFDVLTRIIFGIILLGFAVITVPFIVSFLGAAGIWPASLNGFYLSMQRFLFLAMNNFDKIFPLVFLLFFVLFIIAVIGNIYRARLIGKDKNQVANVPKVSVPNLEYAKQNFTLGQYNFIRIAFYLIFFDVIFSVLLGFIFSLQIPAGWMILLIFFTVALNFISVPLFIIAYILYFVLLAKAESKKK